VLRDRFHVAQGEDLVTGPTFGNMEGKTSFRKNPFLFLIIDVNTMANKLGRTVSTP
jgi:hypothetical protein